MTDSLPEPPFVHSLLQIEALCIYGNMFGEWCDYAPYYSHETAGSIVVNLSRWDAALIVPRAHDEPEGTLPRVVVMRDETHPKQALLCYGRVPHGVHGAFLLSRKSLEGQQRTIFHYLRSFLPNNLKDDRWTKDE